MLSDFGVKCYLAFMAARLHRHSSGLSGLTGARQQPLQDIVRAIQEKVSHQAAFWSKAHGWAPKEAADLLSSVRLEHYSSLALNLDATLLAPCKSKRHESGRLIIGWSHLGSMLECSLQLLLAVHLRDYLKDKNKVPHRWKPSKTAMPHELDLEHLRVFFDKSIWDKQEKKAWTPWILSVQQQRNAIHALKARPLGTWSNLEEAARRYHDFLEEIDIRLPEPDPWL